MKDKHMDNTERDIIQSTIKAYAAKGLKFKMDDISADLGISKKTIYIYFTGKAELCEKVVEYIFDMIAQAKGEALRLPDKTDAQYINKLKKYLTAMPEGLEQVNLAGLAELKEKYPKLYKAVRRRLESNWEPAIELLEEGKRRGIIRYDADFDLFRMMMEESTAAFFERDILKKTGLEYTEALGRVVEILTQGIIS